MLLRMKLTSLYSGAYTQQKSTQKMNKRIILTGVSTANDMSELIGEFRDVQPGANAFLTFLFGKIFSLSAGICGFLLPLLTNPLSF